MMDPRPLVSVIVPTYQMGAFIGEALASIGCQTFQNWEVIVVDDCGPPDGTRELVEGFAAEHPGRRVEYLRLPENRGVSGARNAGAAVAGGAYLAFLDPDDLWHPNHLEVHMAARGQEPVPFVSVSRVGVFFGTNSSEIVGEWGYSNWEKSIFPRSLAMRNVIIPTMVVMPAAPFGEVGGYDEDRSRQHTEDWDLWIRLVDHGMEFRFLDEVTGLYRRHEGGATADRQRMQQRVRAFSSKHHERLFPDLGLATWALSQRVDALEARLNWLQRNPLIRLISGIQKLFMRG